MTLLHRVVARLSEQEIRFALIGAAAMAAHGVSRSTADIDLFTVDRRALGHDLWQIDGAVDLRVGAADDPLAGVARLTAPEEATVDVIVGRHGWQQRLLDRTTPVTLDDVSVPVLDLSGLILMKLYAGGPQDGWDIAQLIALGGEPAAAVVEARIADLPPESRDLWARIRS